MLQLLFDTSRSARRRLPDPSQCARHFTYSQVLRISPSQPPRKASGEASAPDSHRPLIENADIPKSPSAADLLESMGEIATNTKPRRRKRNPITGLLEDREDIATVKLQKESAPRKKTAKKSIQKLALHDETKVEPKKVLRRRDRAAPKTPLVAADSTAVKLRTETMGTIYKGKGQSSKERDILDTLNNAYRSSQRNDTKRLHVISEQLCDDILERMKPSLTRHMGCDIVDINPGAGLWSSKLHEFLKPRSHILMEPEFKTYEPLLGPLLDAPDSTYKLCPQPGLIWSHLNSVLSEEYLPFQKKLPRTDPKLYEPNDTLLAVINLSFYPKRPYPGFTSITKLVVHQLMAAVRSNALFHKYGLVRMLLWVHDEERMIALPRHVNLRRKSSIEAEMSCGSISEVVSSTQPLTIFTRTPSQELPGVKKVVENMEANNIKIPLGRESMRLEQLRSLGSDENPEDIKPLLTQVAEVKSLEARSAAGEFADWKRYDMKREEMSPETKRLRDLRWSVIAFERREQSMTEDLATFTALYTRQREIHDDTSEAALLEKEGLKKQRIEFDHKLSTRKDSQVSSLIGNRIDNYRVLIQSPPALLYDRREAEPMKVHPHEFYPAHEMALIDFEPKALWPSVRADFPASYDIVDYVISILHASPTQSVAQALYNLWPGFSEWAIEHCPGLFNPKEGGDPDLNLMPVRTLSLAHQRLIIEAFLNWPFKPSRYKLLGRMSTVYDGGGETGDLDSDTPDDIV